MAVPDHPRPVVGAGMRVPMMRGVTGFSVLGFRNARPAARKRFLRAGSTRWCGSPPPVVSDARRVVQETGRQLGHQIRGHPLAILPGEGTRWDSLADGQIRMIRRLCETWSWIANLDAFSLDVFGSGAPFSTTASTCRRGTPLAASISVVVIGEGNFHGNWTTGLAKQHASLICAGGDRCRVQVAAVQNRDRNSFLLA